MQYPVNELAINLVSHISPIPHFQSSLLSSDISSRSCDHLDCTSQLRDGRETASYVVSISAKHMV